MIRREMGSILKVCCSCERMLSALDDRHFFFVTDKTGKVMKNKSDIGCVLYME